MTLWKYVLAPGIGRSTVAMDALLTQKELILRAGNQRGIDKGNTLQRAHLPQAAFQEGFGYDPSSLRVGIIDPLLQESIEALFDGSLDITGFFCTVDSQG